MPLPGGATAMAVTMSDRGAPGPNPDPDPGRGNELLELIGKRTAKEQAVVEQFRSEGGPTVREYCPHLTKLDCCRRARAAPACRPARARARAASFSQNRISL
jgi:hypothetical protein